MLSRETYIITSTVRANQIQNIKIACDGKKIVVETIEDAVPKETLTGIEVTTKSAAALKAAVDTEASVDIYTIPKATSTTEAVDVIVTKEEPTTNATETISSEDTTKASTTTV